MASSISYIRMYICPLNGIRKRIVLVWIGAHCVCVCVLVFVAVFISNCGVLCVLACVVATTSSR